MIVVGAGAAGILAAWRAATLGARTLLLEKTARIGTKILISGGGKCNITHAGPIEDVIKAFRPEEARFIRPACYRFTNEQIVGMLTAKGLRVYTRPNGRVFPVDQTAKDVVAVLTGYLERAGVEIRLETPVEGLIVDHGRVVGVRAAHTAFRANSVVLSTGGSSYPASGTTGDGWRWVKGVGHTVVKVRAALAPIHLVTNEDWPARSGISLRDCLLKARQDGREIARWRDDLLWTHHGVSGPTALGISREVAESAGGGPITLEVDLRPDKTFEEVSDEVRTWAADHPKKLWPTFLDSVLPARLVDDLLASAGIRRDLAASNTERKARNRLVAAIKGWELGRVRDVPIEKGEVVAGGVALEEVDPQSMKSRKADGLFLCGEILDVAGPVGGYNLQAAFATGFVAGESAAAMRSKGRSAKGKDLLSN